jgi:hypothetical protein
MPVQFPLTLIGLTMNIMRVRARAHTHTHTHKYRGADKPLARPTSRCVLFDGENNSFDASLVIHIYIGLIFLQL